MSEKNLTVFDYYVLNKFINDYNIKLDDIKNSNICEFRYMCYKLNYFMKEYPLPSIKKNSIYEAVFIEFRPFPHIEFLLRNAIHKLGTSWCYTIVCGKLNNKLIRSICGSISNNINIITLECENITQSEYSNFLMNEYFWNLLSGEKILIYQEDSLIFKNNVLEFLHYDFIGAPFSKQSDDTPNCVGNGGLSIRTKSKMLEVIKNCHMDNLILGNSTIKYMDMVKLEVPPEDVYFSKNLQEFKIGEVANWDIAYQFSSEAVFNPDSFGCHKLWVSCEHWKKHIKQKFNYYNYKPVSNLSEYLHYLKKPQNFDKTPIISNAFDIDLYFFCKVNNIEYINNKSALSYLFKIGLDGFIYHPKQIINYFPDIVFYSFLNNIYVFYLNKILTVQEFTNKYIYNISFDEFSNMLIRKKYDSINDNYDAMILVFIGDEKIGIDLIQKLIEYKKIQTNFNISFCFNDSTKLFECAEIKLLIKNNFDFYSIYTCKELGTDITPTLLMYNDLIKTHKFKHVFKFHTKSIKNEYNNLTNYLLSKPLNMLLIDKDPNCNCIGYPQNYMNLYNDQFNNKLKNKNTKYINIDNVFVTGTIFYCDNLVFQKVLEFIKNNNYRSYLLNNLYENNSINKHFSPIHFIERLFGVIKLY